MQQHFLTNPDVRLSEAPENPSGNVLAREVLSVQVVSSTPSP